MARNLGMVAIRIIVFIIVAVIVIGVKLAIHSAFH